MLTEQDFLFFPGVIFLVDFYVFSNYSESKQQLNS